MDRDDLFDGFAHWLYTEKVGARVIENPLGKKHWAPPPGAPYTENTVKTYLSIVRTYLKRAKNPASHKEALRYIKEHPNTAVVAALTLFFEYLGERLEVPREVKRVVNEITTHGKPQSKRMNHDVLGWEDWAKLIAEFPTDGISYEEAKEIQYPGAFHLTKPERWEIIKAVAIFQLLFALRVGDVLNIQRIQLKRTRKDTLLKIELIPKKRRTVEERVISRNTVAKSSKQWLLPHFDWLVEWLNRWKWKAGRIPTKPFESMEISQRSIYIAYHCALRYVASKSGILVSTHDVRRGIITTLLNKERVPIQKVARWVGHKKVETTMRYDKSSYKDVLADVFK